MKKIRILAASALAATMMLAFTACGSDDDDDVKLADPEIASVTLSTNLYVNQGMLDIFDLTVTDPTGVELTFAADPVKVKLLGEEQQLYPLTLKTSLDKSTIQHELDIHYKLKDNVQVDPNTAIMLYADASVTLTFDNGTTATYTGHSDGFNLTVAQDKLQGLAQNLNDVWGHLESVFDTNGLSINF